jgi:hypothetical protein
LTTGTENYPFPLFIINTNYIQNVLVDISERQKQQKVAMVLLHLLLFIIGATAGTSHNSDFGK